MKTGIELITEERERQIIEERWTPEHDSEHDDNEIAIAAACYALPEKDRFYTEYPTKSFNTPLGVQTQHLLPVKKWTVLWPWDKEWWKPTPDNRIKELTKAGALIAAEIDRLLRDK